MGAAQAQSRAFDIPSQALDATLAQISREAGMQLLLAPELARGLRAPAIRGELDADAAIAAALQGSGLLAVHRGDTVVVQRAEDAGPSLADVTVTDTAFADATTERTNSYTASVMSTTTGLQLTPRETPQSVSVVTRKQIDDQDLSSMEAVLRQSTGINVIRDSGRYRFQSRGFYIDQVEEDGVSSTVPGSSSNPYRSADSMSELEIYDHIEVLRGAAGLTQANGEPGGTINAVRKRPTSDFQARGSFALGSWSGKRASVDVSGGLNAAKTLRGRLVAVAADGDSFKNAVEYRRHAVYGVIDADLGDATVLTLGGLYQRSRETPDLFGLPLGSGGADLGLPRSGYLAADWSKNDFTKHNLFAELTHYFENEWTLSTKFNAIDSDSQQQFAGLASASAAFAGVGGDGLLPMNNMQRYDNTGTQRSLQVNLHGPYQWLGRRHEMFLTALLSRERADSRWRRHMDSTSYDVWTFDPAQIEQPDWSDASILQNDVSYRNRIDQRAVSLGTRLNASDALHLIVGGRYTRFKAGGDYQYQTWAGQPDSEYGRNADVRKNRFVPYLGATYDLTGQTSLYASYTRIFKPQSNMDADGKVLEPVIGTNYELGVKSELFDKRLNLSAAIFQITQKNRALYDSASDAYVPQGKVRSRGYELEASGELRPGWSLLTGYTFNNSKYLETEGSRYTSGSNYSKHTPRHMLRLATNYRLPGQWRRLSIGGGMRVQSETSSLYDVRQGGYSIWQANLQYEISRHARLNLAIDNLTDKRYYENQRTRMNGINNFYGTPRSVSLRLDWMLD
ncbi:TonB-dependent siderophore receptor [Corticibacter populi]|nr:TonB-dependent siderophore receptor [Corticibacter populi]RZS35081.1 outer membrane receptor for ferric coprogen and ferric-rhodotorulic acid [Corticibacter populi]